MGYMNTQQTDIYYKGGGDSSEYTVGLSFDLAALNNVCHVLRMERSGMRQNDGLVRPHHYELGLYDD
jgi:hypothetical protein